MRDLCKECGKRPVAINYRKGDRIFYRSKCIIVLGIVKKKGPCGPLVVIEKNAHVNDVGSHQLILCNSMFTMWMVIWQIANSTT